MNYLICIPFSSLLNWDKTPAEMRTISGSPISEQNVSTSGSGPKSHVVEIDGEPMFIASQVDPSDYFIVL
jgi:hypothetical protein